ncbi:GC-type dockerin domain-anchored protein [Pyxidicoccus caerfyrddinensis]|uniref:GC-type dockerin domain-anchored protein n=1 Tax=Pyxidicoccus caerfyrddinensis TaxID=2709663 RepID=UPI0013DA1645|nr:GC-type dockerin domain-anchored protein [Pyxidicoccus caerfyrddinensis]
MRHIPLWAGAVPLFAATSAFAQAQFITPSEGTRSVSATVIAKDDGVTNVNEEDSRRTYGFEDFNESLVLKASDFPQYDDTHSHADSNGSGTETSSITGSSISAEVTASANGTTQSALSRGYATGNADFYLTFQLNRYARYVVAGDATADTTANVYGGSASLVYIASLTTGVPVLSIDIGNTDADSVRRKGWLFPGPFTLQGDVSALVDAKAGTAGTATAWWKMDIRFYCPSDYDTNGTVNLADRDAFLNAWNAGSLDADADGNGVVNSTDRTTFLLAYGAGC